MSARMGLVVLLLGALVGCDDVDSTCWPGSWRCEGRLLLRCEANAWVMVRECEAECSEGGCPSVAEDLCDQASCGPGSCEAQAVCLCPEGHHGEEGTCVPDPPDPCEGVGCSGHGLCVAVEGEAHCLCDPGYSPRALLCELAVSTMGETLPQAIGEPLALPEPLTLGGLGVREAIGARRSKRSFTQEGITMADLSQLLWAAQGITSQEGKRSAPSAGATYPFEIFVLAQNVEGLAPGLYHYGIGAHDLSLIREGVTMEGLGSSTAEAADGILFLVAVIPRTAQRYEERAERYVLIEGGAIVENISLQAADLGLGTVCIGATSDGVMQEFLGTDALPVAIMPVGPTLD